MNEIALLTDEIKEIRVQHRRELEDWERLHRNEMLEKEYEIAKLKQEVLLLKTSEGGKKLRGPLSRMPLRKRR